MTYQDEIEDESTEIESVANTINETLQETSSLLHGQQVRLIVSS
jgi:hypothetical protein